MNWRQILGGVLLSVVFSLVACSGPKTQPDSDLKRTVELHDEHIIADDGYVLPLRKYWSTDQPKTIVIALHGFNDYSNAFDGMCRYFVAHQVACVAYDQRGFGATELKGIWPKPGRLQDDLQMVVSLFHQAYPQANLFIAGESMGGAVIMTALDDPAKSLNELVRGAILFAPAVWARSTQPWYQRWLLWLGVHMVPGWTPTGEGLCIRATDNNEALRAMGRDEKVIKATRIDAIYGLTNLMDAALSAGRHSSVRMLVLYGDNDQVIPKEPTCQMLHGLLEAKRDFDFIHYPQGYHMLTRDLQAQQVFSDALLWLSGDLQIDPEAQDVSQFCGG